MTIMEIFKAPTLRLKALNKHNITHIIYIEMENVIRRKKYFKKEEKKQHNVDTRKGSSGMHCILFYAITTWGTTSVTVIAIYSIHPSGKLKLSFDLIH